MTIRTKTVLILGAGASAHCGYPLGMQLTDGIIQSIRAARRVFGYAAKSIRWTHAELNQFATTLAQSQFDSIDEFLEERPANKELGKYLIAKHLKEYEDVHKLFNPNDSGWYRYLLRRLESVNWKPDPSDNPAMLTDSTPLSGNNLTIVTFNYDRSLEAYLYQVLMERCEMNANEAEAELAKIPIIHVHGILGEFPESSYRTNFNYQPDAEPPPVHIWNEYMYELSQSLRTLGDFDDSSTGFCNDQFEQASLAINSADIRIFLGFGFHYRNLSRLKIDWSKFADRSVYATLVNKPAGFLENMMRDFEIKESVFSTKDDCDCLGILEHFELLDA